MSNQSFDRYLRIILQHSSNYFSVFSVVFVVIAWFVPIDVSAKAQLTVLFGMLCFLYSGFRAWKDAVRDPSSSEEFRILPKTHAYRPRAFGGDGSLEKITHFTIDFDFINNRDQVTVLYRPEIVSLKTNSDLIDSKPAAVDFKHFPGRIDSWVFPYKFENRSRNSMRCEIDVLLTNNNFAHLFQRLETLQTFEIEFRFTHEDMSASASVKNVKISGTYDEFKEEVLRFWREKGLTHTDHNKSIKATGL